MATTVTAGSNPTTAAAVEWACAIRSNNVAACLADLPEFTPAVRLEAQKILHRWEIEVAVTDALEGLPS